MTLPLRSAGTIVRIGPNAFVSTWMMIFCPAPNAKSMFLKQ
jgi:hypothetical protein